MPETIITPDVLSREGTMVLKNEAVLFNMMRNRADEARFTGNEKVGDTIRIVSPARPDVRRFTGTATPRTAAETEQNLLVEIHLYDQIEVTSAQRTLELDRFSEMYVQPIMKKFAEELALFGAEKLVQIPYHTGNPGDPPDTVAEITALDRVMNTNKAPGGGRVAIVDEFGKADILAIPAFHEADKRGDAGTALRSASMGDALGFEWFMDQSISAHTAGTMQAGAPLVNGAVAAAATVMNIDGGAGTETILRGDLFTVAGAAGYQGVFTADMTAAGGAIAAATFYPEAPVGGFADDAAINIVASHTKNVAFGPGTFSAVTFPPLASQGANSSSFFDAALGFGVRVTFDWSSTTLADTITFDCLAGATTKQPELAAILLG